MCMQIKPCHNVGLDPFVLIAESTLGEPGNNYYCISALGVLPPWFACSALSVEALCVFRLTSYARYGWEAEGRFTFPLSHGLSAEYGYWFIISLWTTHNPDLSDFCLLLDAKKLLYVCSLIYLLFSVGSVDNLI